MEERHSSCDTLVSHAAGQKPTVSDDRLSTNRRPPPAPLVSESARIAPSRCGELLPDASLSKKGDPSGNGSGSLGLPTTERYGGPEHAEEAGTVRSQSGRGSARPAWHGQGWMA